MKVLLYLEKTPLNDVCKGKSLSLKVFELYGGSLCRVVGLIPVMYKASGFLWTGGLTCSSMQGSTTRDAVVDI